MHTALFALWIVASAFIIALAALLAFALIARRRMEPDGEISSKHDGVIFLFDDETLVDATPAARQLLESSPRNSTTWSHLAELLSPSFPQLTETIRDLADLGQITLKSTDGTTTLDAKWQNGLARLSLQTRQADEPVTSIDQQSLTAMTQELDSLRSIAEHGPLPQWRETCSGMITWCNSAYLSLADTTSSEGPVFNWPPAKIFDISDHVAEVREIDSGPDLYRIALTPEDGDRRHWFEVSVQTLPDGDKFCTAMPADRLVKAETTLHEFVTTLTKTFASLPIGLAIFDRSRELAMFNPALMDLTALPADFLISKPSLFAVFDKLREARMIPEPKDYKTWRQQLSDLVAAAENGSYEETWTLPTGMTYRVTGRPHPDGAVGLMFEDISADIAATRRFRTELEIGQAAIDALPQAVVVFTAGGVLAMANNAYGEMWGGDPSESLEDIGVADTIRKWQSACAPSPVWDRLRAFMFRAGPRQAWSANVALQDGRSLQCQFTPLAHGATMATFIHSNPLAEMPSHEDMKQISRKAAEIGV